MSDEGMSNFTPRAQQVLALARKEADRFNHNFVGTEHLLLGVISEEDGAGASIHCAGDVAQSWRRFQGSADSRNNRKPAAQA